MNPECDNSREPKQLYLTLTRCNEDEFTCNNGMCIDIEKRCNLKEDCQDKSDESNCWTVDIPGKMKLFMVFSNVSNQQTLMSRRFHRPM